MIDDYIKNPEYRLAMQLPDEVVEEYELLGHGEYNFNYIFTHPEWGKKLLLRVNTGSQMHLNRQIEYESHALKLLEGSGRTPKIYYVDGSLKYSKYGISVMEFLPGIYPEYENDDDMITMMKALADIHSVKIPEDEVIYGEPEDVPRDTVKLIAPGSPEMTILDECERMVAVYMESPLADEQVKSRLKRLLDRAYEIASDKNDAEGADVRCCVNTELNSTNLLVDNGYGYIVDWEKPLYADPAQDLGHMLAPTTSFWKTDYIMDKAHAEKLIDAYIEAVDGRFDTTGLRERALRLINVTCLRGLTWCAMAWVQYQDPEKEVVNEDTRKKLDDYLRDPFLKTIEELLF